jgi:SAM-dependent methyltransferase
MPFADASFDGAYSMKVSMNVQDKAAFYAEIYRVLRPGGWLVLSEIAQGTSGAPSHPTPWARAGVATCQAITISGQKDAGAPSHVARSRGGDTRKLPRGAACSMARPARSGATTVMCEALCQGLERVLRGVGTRRMVHSAEDPARLRLQPVFRIAGETACDGGGSVAALGRAAAATVIIRIRRSSWQHRRRCQHSTTGNFE